MISRKLTLRCHRSGATPSPKGAIPGFTLIELLIVIAILAALAALLLPAMKSMTRGAQSAACQQNLKKIGQGMIQYAADNEGWFPPHWGGNDGAGHSMNWMAFVAPYISDWDGDDTPNTPMDKVFFCPAAPNVSQQGKTYISSGANNVGLSYGFNYYHLTQNFGYQKIIRLRGLNSLAKTVLVGDIPAVNGIETGIPLPSPYAVYRLYPGLAGVSDRHPGESCNLVFADGHVENLNARWLMTPGEGFDRRNWDPR